MKGSDYSQGSAEHLCVYGDPGSGKSTIVMNLLAAGFKLKYFPVDAGVPRGILEDGKARPYTPDELSRLEVFPLRDTSKFPVGIQTCRKVITGGEYNLCDYHGQINCSVCRSSGADFSRVCLNEMMLDEIAVFDHLTNLTNSALNACWDGGKFAMEGGKDKDNSTFTTWRQQGWQLTDFLSHVQVAPFNVIVIAQEYMAIFEDKSKSIAPHAGTKDFSSTTGSYFGHVIHCSVSNMRHKYGSGSTFATGVLTKSRSHIRIEEMEKPSLAPFFLDPKVGIGKRVAPAGVAMKGQVKMDVVVPSKHSVEVPQEQTASGSVAKSPADILAALRAKKAS